VTTLEAQEPQPLQSNPIIQATTHCMQADSEHLIQEADAVNFRLWAYQSRLEENLKEQNELLFDGKEIEPELINESDLFTKLIDLSIGEIACIINLATYSQQEKAPFINPIFYTLEEPSRFKRPDDYATNGLSTLKELLKIRIQKDEMARKPLCLEDSFEPRGHSISSILRKGEQFDSIEIRTKQRNNYAENLSINDLDVHIFTGYDSLGKLAVAIHLFLGNQNGYSNNTTLDSLTQVQCGHNCFSLLPNSLKQTPPDGQHFIYSLGGAIYGILC
jgi:hypothetical protein